MTSFFFSLLLLPLLCFLKQKLPGEVRGRLYFMFIVSCLSCLMLFKMFHVCILWLNTLIHLQYTHQSSQKGWKEAGGEEEKGTETKRKCMTTSKDWWVSSWNHFWPSALVFFNVSFIPDSGFTRQRRWRRMKRKDVSSLCSTGFTFN